MRHLRLGVGTAAVDAVAGGTGSGHGLEGDHHIRDRRNIGRVELVVHCIGGNSPAGYAEGAVHSLAVAEHILVAGAVIES